MDYCNDCVFRLFNKKCYNVKGIGNPNTGLLIVVPNVDYPAYKKGDMEFSSQVEVIKNVISSTGELDDLYILPLIRCNQNISCPITDDVVSRCFQYLIRDFRIFHFTDVMLLGDAAKKFLNIDNVSSYLTNIMVSKNNNRYFVNYSPLIKYTNDEKFEEFKNHLIKWYNSAKLKYYDGYEIIYL